MSDCYLKDFESTMQGTSLLNIKVKNKRRVVGRNIVQINLEKDIKPEYKSIKIDLSSLQMVLIET